MSFLLLEISALPHDWLNSPLSIDMGSSLTVLYLNEKENSFFFSLSELAACSFLKYWCRNNGDFLSLFSSSFWLQLNWMILLGLSDCMCTLPMGSRLKWQLYFSLSLWRDDNKVNCGPAAYSRLWKQRAGFRKKPADSDIVGILQRWLLGGDAAP